MVEYRVVVASTELQLSDELTGNDHGRAEFVMRVKQLFLGGVNLSRHSTFNLPHLRYERAPAHVNSRNRNIEDCEMRVANSVLRRGYGNRRS